MGDQASSETGLWLLRGIAWGVTLVACTVVVLWQMHVKEHIDIDSWVRCSERKALGREHCRNQIQIGMTQDEVERRIGKSRGQSCRRYSNKSAPGFNSAAGPVWHHAVRYPEYGFCVIYDDEYDPLSVWYPKNKNSGEWKVIAIEDLP